MYVYVRTCMYIYIDPCIYMYICIHERHPSCRFIHERCKLIVCFVLLCRVAGPFLIHSRSHVTHLNESCHNKWVMSHIWKSHVTHLNQSCHNKWVMSHIWMSHVTHLNESCHTSADVMLHIWRSHVTHMNESRHTYERVTSHSNESCHTHEWVLPHVGVGPVTHMIINMIPHMCDTTHSISHVTINESGHTSEWVMSHICGIICGPVTHVIIVTWLMTRHVTHMNESCHKYARVTSHTCIRNDMSHGTQLNVSHVAQDW